MKMKNLFIVVTILLLTSCKDDPTNEKINSVWRLHYENEFNRIESFDVTFYENGVAECTNEFAYRYGSWSYLSRNYADSVWLQLSFLYPQDQGYDSCRYNVEYRLKQTNMTGNFEAWNFSDTYQWKINENGDTIFRKDEKYFGDCPWEKHTRIYGSGIWGEKLK